MSQNPETEDLFKVLQCNGFNICDKFSFKHVAELSFQAAAIEYKNSEPRSLEHLLL